MVQQPYHSNQPDADFKICPFCAETVRAAAILCRFCNSDLSRMRPVPSKPQHQEQVTEPRKRRTNLAPQPAYIPQRQNDDAWGAVLFFMLPAIVMVGVGFFVYARLAGGQSSTNSADAALESVREQNSCALSEKLSREKAADLESALLAGNWREARHLVEQVNYYAALSKNADLIAKAQKIRSDFYSRWPEQ